jgi:hypothetical protein
MNGISSGDLCGGDNPVAAKIAVFGCRAADANRAIGQFQVGRFAIFFRENANGFKLQITASAYDPQRNFTSVGYENSSKHEVSGGERVH